MPEQRNSSQDGFDELQQYSFEMVEEYLRTKVVQLIYAYSRGSFGSAVPIKYRGKCYLVTAWHVLDSDDSLGGFQSDMLLFSCRPDEPEETIVCKKWSYFEDQDNERVKITLETLGHQLTVKKVYSNRYEDIVALEVDENELREKLGKTPFEEDQLVDIDTIESAWRAVLGYPEYAVDETLSEKKIGNRSYYRTDLLCPPFMLPSRTSCAGRRDARKVPSSQSKYSGQRHSSAPNLAS
jgi:hypothetical protein